jgi:hypothetical protein
MTPKGGGGGTQSPSRTTLPKSAVSHASILEGALRVEEKKVLFYNKEFLANRHSGIITAKVHRGKN